MPDADGRVVLKPGEPNPNCEGVVEDAPRGVLLALKAPSRPGAWPELPAVLKLYGLEVLAPAEEGDELPGEEGEELNKEELGEVVLDAPL